MFGNGTLRDNWNTQWGPEPVLSLCTTEARKAPITLADSGQPPETPLRPTMRAADPRRFA
ncbi:MAG: hypothetical protein R3D59_08145 [Paracoccaceae bacterium]